MKTNTHPKWFDEARVVCSCGNTFTTGATIPEISIEVCSNCHPFYTGQMKYIDTAGRVDAFKNKQSKAKESVLSKSQRRNIKRQKKLEKELERPDTLEELRKDKSKKANK